LAAKDMAQSDAAAENEKITRLACFFPPSIKLSTDPPKKRVIIICNSNKV
jgi:hypothetical protein